MLSNRREMKQSFAVFDEPDNNFQAGDVQLRHFNLAINPHLDEINTYRHLFYAEARH